MKTSFIILWTDIFRNPFYFIRLRLFQVFKQYIPELSGIVLDFGCGSKPYEALFVSTTSYIGLDIEVSGHSHIDEKIDVFYDGKNIPFGDDHFDNVFCSEVMEHVFNPDESLQEIKRVLKPGGKLLLTCPFVWPEHEAPFDYARYSSFGITHLLEKNGFEIIQRVKTGHFAEVILQQMIFYIFVLLPKKPKILYLILHQIFILPFIVSGIFLNAIMFGRLKRKELFHNNVILAKKRL